MMEEGGLRAESGFLCVACQTVSPRPLATRSGLPGDHDPAARFSILSCPACGTGRTFPFPAQDELIRLYQNYGSRPSETTGDSPRDILVTMRRQWGTRTAGICYVPRGGSFRLLRCLLASFLVPRATLLPIYTDLLAERAKGRPIRLLDVGCGSCEFLQFASAAGVEAVGLEITEEAAGAGRKLGLDVRSGTIQDISPGQERFDIVRFSHVLEHVPDPRADLLCARRLLDGGGYLMLAVPQIPSAVTVLLKNRAHYHLPFHLHHFSRRGLRILVENSGFRVLRVKSKSNSVLAQSVSRWIGSETLANNVAIRLGCIAAEMAFDALGCGDAVELHAVAT